MLAFNGHKLESTLFRLTKNSKLCRLSPNSDASMRRNTTIAFFESIALTLDNSLIIIMGALIVVLHDINQKKIYEKKIQWLFLFCYIEIKDKADTFDIVYIS